MGVNVLGLADEPYEWLHPDLKVSLGEYYRVDDMHNYDQLLRACGYLTHRHGKLDRIDSHVEYWLETEARIRSDFNIPRPNMRDLDRIKRKSGMKAAFIEAGVPVARGEVVHTIQDARTLIAETGYPVVAKPDIGAGAANTFKIASDQALEQFFAEKPPVDYIMEAFVRGDIRTFDGLTDRDGTPVFVSSMRYSQGIMETVNEDLDVYYYTVRKIAEDLEDAGRRVLRAFNVRERFFHFEFFRTDEGNLVALEVNMRPPGGPTIDLLNYAHDIDLYREWADIVVNNHFTAAYSRKFFGCYVGRKFNKDYTHTHDEIMKTFGRLIVHHGEMPPVFSLAMGDYHYILRVSDLGELRAAAQFIQQKRG